MPALTSRRERSALTGRNNLSSMNSTASNSINSTPRDMPSIRPSTSANLPLSISPVKVNTSDRPQTQASTRLTSVSSRIKSLNTSNKFLSTIVYIILYSQEMAQISQHCLTCHLAIDQRRLNPIQRR